MNQGNINISTKESSQISKTMTKDLYLLNSINEGVIQIDIEGNIVFANHRLTEMSGYDFQDVIGKHASIFIDKENIQVFQNILNDRKKGITGKYKLRVTTKSGELKEFLINGAPVKNDSGNVIGAIGTFNEIKDLQLEEKLIKKDSKKINELFDKAHIAFWIFSIKNKKIEFLSQGIERIFETNLLKIYQENSLKKFILPEDLKKVIQHNKINLHAGEYEIEFRIITSGGKIKWVKDKAVILKDENGKVDKIISYIEDISKLKNSEENLLKNELENENIMHSIPYSFLTIDSAYKVTKSFLKPGERGLLITSTKSIVGKHLNKVIEAQTYKNLSDLLPMIFATKYTVKSEIEVTTKNQTLWFEMNLCSMNNNNALLILKNITSLKSNISKIKRLFNINDQSTEMVVITDNNGIIEYVNAEFSKTTGYLNSEVLNTSISILKSNKHNALFYKKMWDTLLMKKQYKGKLINRKKTGELFVEEKIITPFIGIGGEITHFISSSRYIETIDLQKFGLKKSANTTEIFNKLNKNKGSLSLIKKQENDQKFIANKIHEGLNQMLSAVLMNLESLNLNGKLNESEQTKISFVNEVLLNIMNELRGISSKLSPVGLYKFGLHASIQQLIDKLNKSEITAKFIYNSNLIKHRFRSEVEINYYRILQELLSNVMIHSKASEVIINLFYTNKKLSLEVIDNGIGIEKRTLGKIKQQKLGIQNIEERAKSIQSKTSIETKPKSGFKIKLETKIKPQNYD